MTHMPCDERKFVLENIVGVKAAVVQESLDYVTNLLRIKPDYVMHRDDWNTGVLRGPRQSDIDTLKPWGGKLIEPDLY